jgi:hypothetical protein
VKHLFTFILDKKMLGLLSNGKSVIIAEERRKSCLFIVIHLYICYVGFCRSPKFSLDFPKKLSGIINPDEFQQSVTNINRACKTTIWEKILLFSLFLCSLIGLLIFIAGVSVIFLSIAALWIPLMTIGFALFLTFLTIAIFVSSRVYRLCDTRLDKAVEAESKKYSKRSPIPTKWRLDMTIYTRRFSIAATPTDIQYFVSRIILS